MPDWGRLRSSRPTCAEIEQWFGDKNPFGIGIICGATSGGLEVIDIDTKNDPTGQLNQRAEGAIRSFAPGVWERLPRERTPSGGLHLYFRSANPAGNLKLAYGPNSAKREVIVETRGEGGFIVSAPTPGYVLLQGELHDAPFLTSDERESLLAAARSLDMTPTVTSIAPQGQAQPPTAPLTVLDDFNTRADPLPLLRSRGWEVGPEQPDGSMMLRRPGKTDSGWSATWNHEGRRTLCVFSSNAPPFENSPTTYSPSAVYAHLECNGDFKRAAAELRKSGYGPALLGGGTGVQIGTDLRSRLKACRFDAATQPPKPSPRFFLNNTGICTPGNLTTIAAQAKAGKSALIGAAIAAAICAENQTQGCDTLGFTATPPKGRRLLHFDTEQSPYDADRLVRRSLQRASAQAGVAFLDSYRVAGITPPNLRSALKMLMTELSSVHGVFGVIIDGVADFVSDVNDAAECNAFIAELHELAIDHDCPIICILHENPTQDSGKMRGHLGSQLERKAESNLRLKRVEGVTSVFGDKMRGAPILEKDGPAFRWSVTVDMHMSTTSAGQVAMVKKQAKCADLAEDVWQLLKNPTYARRCDVIKAIIAARPIKNSTAEDRFDDMRALRIIIKDLKTGFWSLNPI